MGFALLLALLSVVLAQSHQYARLREALAEGQERQLRPVDDALHAHLQLTAAWWQQRAQPDATPAPLPAAAREWARQVEALDRLRHELATAPAAQTVADDGLLRALDAALLPAHRLHQLLRNELDPATGSGAATLARHDDVLQASAAPLASLRQAVQARSEALAQAREQAVQRQARWGLLLTGFMTLLTLAFAAIAMRQVRQLRARRNALEQLAASLSQARREAEAASQAKSAFLANISHEIRTPFHGLMGMLSLLRETNLNARQVDHLRTATESADHLLAILNDILDMSKLESGRLTLAPAPTDLRRLLHEIEALMRPQATAKSLALHIDVDPGVPERVLCDATRLKQILFNLLANGLKFSDQGRVSLVVRPLPAALPQIEFAVSDTGIGMDEATQARLFNRFAQGDDSRARRHGGTGLGLEISRNLARLMHGDITVSSRLGEGSTFRLQVPLPAVAPEAASPAHPGSGGASSLRSLRVLVAEDHPVNRQYVAALLENLGHRARFCTNGEEAVAAARDEAFDLVLMDLHMPLMDGVDATRAIRALPDSRRSTVPIVALTADAFADTRDRCLVAGMNDFLAKPVSPGKLATLLRQLFGTPTAGGADAAPAPPAATGPAPGLVDRASIAASLQAMPRAQLAGMMRSFLDQGPQTVQHLRAAVRDAQPLALRVNAHAAKGAALNLGLTALAHTAQALQEGATHLPAHEIARLVQRYEELLPATRDAVAREGLLG
jgi:two-component system, sensor histidine kinase